MNITVFHGSPRKGNTYFATRIFMDELSAQGDVHYTKFVMPDDLSGFCTGCTLCLSGKRDKCPNRREVKPIVNAIINADALIFATPHYGASDMPGSMKNLLDHLDFLTLNISPMPEVFLKKAFIITTGSGSTAAIHTIKKSLKHWGLNRVYSLGFRLYIDKWDKMPPSKQERFEKKLRQRARKFYMIPKQRPYLSTIFFYYISKFIIKKYVGEGNYPYEYWKEKGYFKKRPF